MSSIAPTPGLAARLYEQTKVFGQGLTNGPQAAVAAGGEDFGTFVGKVGRASIDTLRRGEAVSIAGVQGKASAQQVVEGVMAAEMTLQAAVAIRDKMVQAYQDIMRMPI